MAARKSFACLDGLTAGTLVGAINVNVLGAAIIRGDRFDSKKSFFFGLSDARKCQCSSKK